MILAAIDLGTVTSRLLIGQVDDSTAGKVKVLARDIIITNIGEGLAASGVISDAAIARVSAALLQFKEVIARVQAERKLTGMACVEVPVQAVATSAMRDAENSQAVLAEFSKLGIDVEVIAGAREAELSFLGTLSGFELPATPQPVMSIDVGGGSTEVIFGTVQTNSRSSVPKPLIEIAHAFNIGSRRVTEMFLASDPPQQSELDAAKQWINSQISDFFAKLPGQAQTIYAVAGTATSAISIREQMRVYDSKLVHGSKLSIQELDDLLANLAAMTLEQRSQVIGLQPGRAPVIVGGLLCLRCALAASAQNQLTISETDILEGIILSHVI
jgi:exopolyphosphatase/guanosine-5'-triphosphate,3'-diphosphate pyrophosphatase